MENSPSLKSQYMELVKGLLRSIGIKTSPRRLSELLCLIEQHCYWFQYQTEVQLNLKEWKVVQKELRRQHQKGNVIPLRLWTLCSAIMQALLNLLYTLFPTYSVSLHHKYSCNYWGWSSYLRPDLF